MEFLQMPEPPLSHDGRVRRTVTVFWLYSLRMDGPEEAIHHETESATQKQIERTPQIYGACTRDAAMDTVVEAPNENFAAGKMVRVPA
jgi:hypothetical protein